MVIAVCRGSAIFLSFTQDPRSWQSVCDWLNVGPIPAPILWATERKVCLLKRPQRVREGEWEATTWGYLCTEAIQWGKVNSHEDWGATAGEIEAGQPNPIRGPLSGQESKGALVIRLQEPGPWGFLPLQNSHSVTGSHWLVPSHSLPPRFMSTSQRDGKLLAVISKEAGTVLWT